ncbi:MAG TPA: DNA-3-methyladenine glycosylase I [Actinomycetota bacterium]|nr:DNA-3-methyladenine glycosylase I [Actinomycetota bacterium]
MEVPPSGAATGSDGVTRCWWSLGDELYEHYHDHEWARPVADDRRLFEKVCLEAFQSGLSWLIILRKREGFRRAFQSFDFETIASFDDRDVERLMNDASIVRNRAKIQATINNARRCVELVEERGGLAAHVWSFEPDPSSRPATLDWATLTSIGPSHEAVALAKDLKRRGWSFVGPTTLYSFMEAMGVVNDHVTACDLRDEVEAERDRFKRPSPR